MVQLHEGTNGLVLFSPAAQACAQGCVVLPDRHGQPVLQDCTRLGSAMTPCRAFPAYFVCTAMRRGSPCMRTCDLVCVRICDQLIGCGLSACMHLIWSCRVLVVCLLWWQLITRRLQPASWVPSTLLDGDSAV